MTSNNFVSKRHIPEEELHAYLDQALSRSQCVEIESHLAVCSVCRDERDAIAALRDRTTALLSTLAPPTIHTPPFAELRQRHLERSARRSRTIRRSAWAASVVLALGFGWMARELATAPATDAQAQPEVSLGTVPSEPITTADLPTVDAEGHATPMPQGAGPEAVASARRTTEVETAPVVTSKWGISS